MLKERRGDVLWLLITALAVLFLLAMSLSWQLAQQRSQVGGIGDRLAVHQLALAGIERTAAHVRALVNAPLLKPDRTIDEDVLALLDRERAKHWARAFTYEPGDLPLEGSVRVTAQLAHVTPNPFETHVDRSDVVPPGLEPYRERIDEDGAPETGPQPLGGWDGRLKLTAVARLRGARTTVEVVQAMRVVDVTPPAPDHTLFIAGEAPEELREGTFHLSNFPLPDTIRDRIHELTLALNEVLALPDVSPERSHTLANVDAITRRLVEVHAAGDARELLALARSLDEHVAHAGLPEKIERTVDDLIVSLDPRDWGRVRTNGTLKVWLPLFAPDDIIGYFTGGAAFTQTHVGFTGHDNRLHDPYLSVYTHFEGAISKCYRTLTPDRGAIQRTVEAQRYTINTRFDYPRRYPKRRAVPLLERLARHAPRYATRVLPGPAVLTGTPDAPIALDGIWFAPDGVTISGPFTGRGLIVSGKGLTIAGNVTRSGRADAMLGLAALSGNIRLAREVGDILVEAGLFAEDGVRGSASAGLELKGNLACHTLNRPAMPRWFSCRFDPLLKNHVADNLHGSLSPTKSSFRVL